MRFPRPCSSPPPLTRHPNDRVSHVCEAEPPAFLGPTRPSALPLLLPLDTAGQKVGPAPHGKVTADSLKDRPLSFLAGSRAEVNHGGESRGCAPGLGDPLRAQVGSGRTEAPVSTLPLQLRRLWPRGPPGGSGGISEPSSAHLMVPALVTMSCSIPGAHLCPRRLPSPGPYSSPDACPGHPRLNCHLPSPSGCGQSPFLEPRPGGGSIRLKLTLQTSQSQQDKCCYGSTCMRPPGESGSQRWKAQGWVPGAGGGGGEWLAGQSFSLGK